MTFDDYIARAWDRHLVNLTRLDPEIRDAPRRLLAYKTSFWAGAETYRAAFDTLLERFQKTGVGQEDFERLNAGLDRFGASLQPLRRLDS